jgi:hypothetical protein
MGHQPREVQQSRGFGGAQPGAGRPPKPRVIDVLRERIEADIDKWLKPLEDGLAAERMVVARNGEIVGSEPDHAIRLSAFREGMDRSHGRPKQSTEISGGLTIMDIATEDDAP